MGWNYWYNWTIILPAELSASAIIINYWNKSVNNAVWISICMVVVIFINMLGAGMATFLPMHCKPTHDRYFPPGVYGEAEFIFACVISVESTNS